MKLRSHLFWPITRTVRATRLGGLAWLYSYSSFAWELRTDSFALVTSSSVSIPPARSTASPSISRSSVDSAGGGGRTGVAGKILSHPWHDCGVSQDGRSHAHCGPWTVSKSHAWVPTGSSYSNCTNYVRIRSAAVTSLRHSTKGTRMVGVIYDTAAPAPGPSAANTSFCSASASSASSSDPRQLVAKGQVTVIEADGTTWMRLPMLATALKAGVYWIDPDWRPPAGVRSGHI